MSDEPRIPSELFERIVSNYGPRDASTLLACCLTSRAMKLPAQASLFASVDLARPKMTEKHYRAFRDSILGSPHFPQCVVTLKVNLAVSGLSVLKEVFPHLQNVRNLSLLWESAETSLDWLGPDENIEDFLIVLFADLFPQLHSLHFQGIKNFIWVFPDIENHCKQIRELGMTKVHFGNGRLYYRCPASLRSLYLDEVEADEFPDQLRSMTWKSLTFMDKGGWLELLRRPSLLTSSVNTLVHLNLGRALEQLLCNLFQSRLNTTRPVIADLDLSRFKSLESFTASFTPPHASYLFHWIEYGSVDRWTVVKVTLNLLLETGSDLFRPEFRPLDLDWSSFDSLLDQPSCVFGPNFSGFLEFTLPDNVEFDHMAELKKAIIKALPKTAKRGMLRVRERDNEGTRLTSSEDS